MPAPIDLDWNAATPPDPRVLEAAHEAAREHWANPSSPHAAGRAARAAIEEAREQVAALLSVDPGGVIFTASGTEALNLAAVGLVPRGGRVVASAIEHKALHEPLARRAKRGDLSLVHVPPDATGVVPPDELSRAIAPPQGPTHLACVLAAQNETGVLQPIDDLHEAARRAGVPLLVDAAQAVGRIAREWRTGWDYLVLSGHKLRAPRGAAALVRRRGARAPEPLLVGGGQELGHRAGTEDVGAIVGLGVACTLVRERVARARELEERRAAFEKLLHEMVPDAVIAGETASRLPQTTLLLVPGARSEDLIAALDLEGVRASAGSACSSGALEPSHVLAAMRVPERLARGALRLSFGETTTADELARAARVVARVVTAVRSSGGE